jgi:hypothetical protein
MATVEIARQQLLIGGEWTDARSGQTSLANACRRIGISVLN